MSFLDGYMRGPNYSNQTSPLDIYNFIQQGYDTGVAQAKAQRISQLAQQAYGQTGDARSATVQQAIGLDPQAGYKMADVGTTMDAQAAALKQKKVAIVANGAKMILQALQQGNDAAAQGAYQAIVPVLQSYDPSTPLPSTLDKAHLGNIYKIVAASGASMPDQPKPISVSPDATLIDPNNYKVLYQGQGDAGEAVPGMTYNGMPVFRDKLGNLKDVHGDPIQQGSGTAAPAPAAGVTSGLPAETQAYVPKIMAALGSKPAFDAQGNPTPDLLNAVQQVESGGDPNAVSPKGAQGAYQLMPATASSVGVTNPNDPAQARAGASQYLSQLYKQFGGNVQQAIAAYNAGPSRVQSALASQGNGGLQYTPSGKGGAPSGYRFKSDGTLEAIPGGPADKGASATVLGDPTLTGQAYLASIPDPAMRALIVQYANGQQQIPRVYRNSKAGEISAIDIAKAVAQYDPTFNASDYNSRNRTRIAFTTGQPYQQMLALNQAAAHLGQLNNAVNGTSGVSAPFGIGSAINKAVNAFEDPKTGQVTHWNTVADALGHEVRKVFAGTSGGTLQELNGYLSTLSANNSLPQKQAALQSIAQLLQSRIDLLKQSYEQGMGKAGDPFATTFPEAANTLNTMATENQDQVGKPLGAAPAQSADIDALLKKYGVQ